MADDGKIARQMAASYEIEITGVRRARNQLANVDKVIADFRAAGRQYSNVSSVTIAGQIGSKDVLVTKFDAMTGNIQTKVGDLVADAMEYGVNLQTKAMRAATTDYGLSGKGRGKPRNGPGRDDTGTLIDAITSNVERLRQTDRTIITGFHGWSTKERKYFSYQEKGAKAQKSKGSSAGNRKPRKQVRYGDGSIHAVNSLGQAIPPVREFLKAHLGAAIKS